MSKIWQDKYKSFTLTMFLHKGYMSIYTYPHNIGYDPDHEQTKWHILWLGTLLFYKLRDFRMHIYTLVFKYN
jgi:hypothetical protein